MNHITLGCVIVWAHQLKVFRACRCRPRLKLREWCQGRSHNYNARYCNYWCFLIARSRDTNINTNTQNVLTFNRAIQSSCGQITRRYHSIYFDTRIPCFNTREVRHDAATTKEGLMREKKRSFYGWGFEGDAVSAEELGWFERAWSSSKTSRPCLLYTSDAA